MRYYVGYFIAALTAASLYIGGMALWLSPVILFGLHPLLDLVVGRAEPVEPPRKSRVYNVLFFFAVGTVTFFVWWGVHLFSIQTTRADQVAVLLSVGLITGLIGIATAHELIHRQSALFEWMGYLILWQVGFGHWAVEHVHTHHKHVGTPQDPATPRKNEWLFAYWMRSYFVGQICAWKTEEDRLKRKRAFQRIFANKVNLSWLVQLGLIAVFYTFWDLDGVVFYVGQSAFAILLLKTVDYIEHYGLVRNKKPNGMYEPVRDEHSWDCDYCLTNWTVINLGYHAHHHRKPLVEYQNLVTALGSKRMPLGYSGMLLLAMIPPLYFKVMNQRLDPLT